MKILRLSTFLDFGGVETRLANISYVEDDNEWVFVCLNREGKASEIIRRKAKRVINLRTGPSVYSIKTFFEVYKQIKKESPDVIHTSGAEANFHGILAAKLAGVPKIIGEEIGTPDHGKMAKFVFSKIYKLVDFVVGNSDAVLKVVHEVDSVPYSKLRKVENPIIFKKLPVMESSNRDQKIFKILMVSRLEPVKNIAGVLNVVSRLVKETNHGILLTIVGSGSLREELENKVRELNLVTSVIFAGFIKNPYPFFIDSDLYILNSFSEGFSNSLIEAMYSETVSLSTDVGAAKEIIEDGVNGFIVPVGEEDVLYNKIKNIVGMPVRQREEIALNAKMKIVSNYSLEKHIEKLMEIYKHNI